ncbi:MAG: hypothetical protein JST86_11960 [Bacteroidetes bacterium]|nr:hypothetical protein [Bacteroidota bacterium]
MIRFYLLFSFFIILNPQITFSQSKKGLNYYKIINQIIAKRYSFDLQLSKLNDSTNAPLKKMNAGDKVIAADSDRVFVLLESQPLCNIYLLTPINTLKSLEISTSTYIIPEIFIYDKKNTSLLSFYFSNEFIDVSKYADGKYHLSLPLNITLLESIIIFSENLELKWAILFSNKSIDFDGETSNKAAALFKPNIESKNLVSHVFKNSEKFLFKNCTSIFLQKLFLNAEHFSFTGNLTYKFNPSFSPY